MDKKQPVWDGKNTSIRKGTLFDQTSSTTGKDWLRKTNEQRQQPKPSKH